MSLVESAEDDAGIVALAAEVEPDRFGAILALEPFPDDWHHAAAVAADGAVNRAWKLFPGAAEADFDRVVLGWSPRELGPATRVGFLLGSDFNCALRVFEREDLVDVVVKFEANLWEYSRMFSFAHRTAQ